MTSNKFQKVKKYYDANLWTIKMVYQAVLKGWITAEEFTIITNQSFEDFSY